MNKIHFAANADTNYVYHMLSAARCGYDNAYGERYREHYPAEELSVFRQYEDELTVRGGEHCGRLYYLMVILPARGEIPCDQYYRALLETRTEDIPLDFLPYEEAVRKLCRIMIRWYDDYLRQIWPAEKARLLEVIRCYQKVFDAEDMTARAEAMVGARLPAGVFTAMLVGSVSGGAEAIDISETQDVFGSDRSPEDALWFIGHEYIIYLLKEALQGEDAFTGMETWALTEGMAEYYLKKVLGSTRFFSGQQKIARLCEAMEKEGIRGAPMLYRAVRAAEIPE